MKYAIFKTGGKQYKAEAGKTITIDLIKTDKKTHVFEEVLLIVDGDKVEVGSPFVKGASVKATVLDDIKADKIRVARFKAKSKYRKTKGHRQKHSQVKIDSISLK